MLKLSSVIKANIELSIINIIKNYIWKNKNIEELLKKECESWNKDNRGLEMDLNLSEIKSFYKEYINGLYDNNNFKSFIKEIRFYTKHPIPKSFKKLMENEGLEEFKTYKELHSFIINKVIPATTIL